MKIYIFNLTTFEFESEMNVLKDNLKSLLLGKECYHLPPNSTIKPPPCKKNGYAIIWKNNDWHYIKDNRGRMVISGNKAYPIKYLGEIKSNERILSDEEVKLLWSDKYICQDGKIIEREKTKKEKQQECIKQIDMLLLTRAILDNKSEEFNRLKEIMSEFDRIN